MLRFYLLPLILTFLCMSCTDGDLYRHLKKTKGIVHIEDDGVVEGFVSGAYEWLTGNKLGRSKEDLLKNYLSLDDAAVILQNVVEFHHKQTMALREHIIEVILFKAKYDKTMDGKIEISAPDVKKTKKRVKRIKRISKAIPKKKS